jgi:hypothetical protein
MRGFKSLGAARCTIAGIEVRHAIRKGQLAHTGAEYQRPADQFYSLLHNEPQLVRVLFVFSQNLRHNPLILIMMFHPLLWVRKPSFIASFG